MVSTIRVRSEWIKKGKTARTTVEVDNVLKEGNRNTVYFHSNVTGTHYQWTQPHFLKVYRKA